MQSLLQAMEDGQIKVGEELPSERDLAVTLGIGRGSLRECLSVLEYLNILETHGNRKVVIKDAQYFRKAVSFVRLSDQQGTLLDSVEFRRANEVAIVELACERATEEDLDRLNRSLLRLEKDMYDYAADAEFHEDLALASHNAIFAAAIDLFTAMILQVRLRYYTLPNYYQRTLDSHRRIYLAIRDRDKDRAKDEMMKHVNLITDFMRESQDNGQSEES
ncbi:MAG: FCD domain-containing protein [Oscillibacter sp.]